MTEFQQAVSLLRDGGFAALSVILAWAFWRKDAQLNGCHETMLAMAVSTTKAMADQTAVLVAHKEILARLADRT